MAAWGAATMAICFVAVVEFLPLVMMHLRMASRPDPAVKVMAFLPSPRMAVTFDEPDQS